MTERVNETVRCCPLENAQIITFNQLTVVFLGARQVVGSVDQQVGVYDLNIPSINGAVPIHQPDHEIALAGVKGLTGQQAGFKGIAPARTERARGIGVCAAELITAECVGAGITKVKIESDARRGPGKRRLLPRKRT